MQISRIKDWWAVAVPRLLGEQRSREEAKFLDSAEQSKDSLKQGQRERERGEKKIRTI